MNVMEVAVSENSFGIIGSTTALVAGTCAHAVVARRK
jgi:hypothetical protein